MESSMRVLTRKLSKEQNKKLEAHVWIWEFKIHQKYQLAICEYKYCKFILNIKNVPTGIIYPNTG